MDLFNLIVFEVYHRCTIDFPSDACFTADEVVEDIKGYYDDNEVSSEAVSNKIYDTVYWLIREGFLRDRKCDAITFRVSLSHKGMEACNIKTALTGSTYFDEFKKGLKKQSAPGALSLVTSFFSAAS